MNTASTGGFEAVLDHLTTEILDGRVVPGDRLPNERDLASQLGRAAAPSVRRSRCCRPRGRHLPHRPRWWHTGRGEPGAALGRMLKLHVALDAISFSEVTETRVVLERAAAYAAVERLDDAAIDALEAMVIQMKETKDSVTFNSLDTGFHVAIAGLGANRLIRDVTVAIREAVAKPILVAENALPDWEVVRAQLNVEHEAIFDALRQRDGRLAAERVEAHIRQAHRALLP
ncbi:FadR family transcriptional regulator [Tessaracoccus sp. HDW20]|nr:FadR family transcriptional regulator [Tessaracoccus coleopterorum]